MTLDEAIKIAEERAEDLRKQADDYIFNHADGCLKKAEEQEQIAEWLKEVKRKRISDNQTYNGCLILMNMLVDAFHDYVVNTLNIDIEKLNDDELFELSINQEEIVKKLFTVWDGDSIQKCRELGIKADTAQLFCFDELIYRREEKGC